MAKLKRKPSKLKITTISPNIREAFLAGYFELDKSKMAHYNLNMGRIRRRTSKVFSEDKGSRRYTHKKNWLTSLDYWIIRYAKGLLQHGIVHDRLFQLVLSFGTKQDRQRYLQENSTWLFPKESEEEGRPFLLGRARRMDAEAIAELLQDYIDEHPETKAISRVASSLRRYLDQLVPEKLDFSQSPREKNLADLKKLLKLTDTETEMIRFFYCLYFSQLEVIANHYIDDLERLYEFIHMTTGEPMSKIRRVMHPQSRLFAMGILQHEEKIFPSNNSEYTLQPDIAYCISGHKTIREYLQKVIQQDRRSVYPLSSFQVSAESVFIAQRLLEANRPVRLLVHGLTGTGKTEFVRSLCRSVNVPTYFLVQGADGSPTERKSYLEMANQMLLDQNAIVVVDEADELLNTGYRFLGYVDDSVNKGWLNDFLDRAQIKLVFITNDISSIEDSVLRRFQYNIRFDQKMQGQEVYNWKRALRKKSIRSYLSEDFLDSITARYHLTPASLTNAIQALEMILRPEDYEQNKIEHYFEELLASHEKIVYKERKKLSDLISEKYDVSLIHTDIPAEEILTALRNYLKNTSKTKPRPGSGVNLLFWGPPGTGKTEFTKYLARELKRKIIIRRGSDLLNPYVGVTEKLIARSFEEASASQGILLVDEADSFFIRRETAWRNYEISHTNEFLNQMENHSCILICCTNLIKNLDMASLRRFHWKVEFKPLRSKDRLLVYERYFPHKASAYAKKRLLELEDLTHGDVRAVYNKLLFRDLEKIREEEIIEALFKEVEYRRQQNLEKKVTGFLG
ncbi:MAG: AAA family ATPase [Leptospiraceae bacterium]|nr:AAA family ATPase [Leptospiraceae bacterium]